VNVAFFVHSLISDWNHGNAHFLRGVCSELLERGHRLRIFEPESAWSVENLLHQEGPKCFTGFYRAYPGLDSIRYQTIKPAEMLAGVDLAIVHEWNDKNLINELGRYRRHRSRPILLFHDTHHRAVSESVFLSDLDLQNYDGILAYGESLARLYRERGENVWVWHEAADIRIFKPLPFAGAKSDLVWIGNWGDGERTQELLEFLLEPVRQLRLEATIHGVRYPKQALSTLAEFGIQYGGWLPNYDVPRVFARHRVTVHIPRRPYVTQLPGIPTIRPFEALACGIPLVTSPWQDSEGLFVANRDFLVAHSTEEMVSQLKELLSSPGLAQDLVKHGLRTIKARHTCSHRVDQLLKIWKGLTLGTE
jgi:spore maturation protein CgeB